MGDILPESVRQALARIQDASDEDLVGDDILSRVVANVTQDIPPNAQVHGAALVLVTASEDGEVSVVLATDVWSLGGLKGLNKGLKAALERTSTALSTAPITPETGDA